MHRCIILHVYMHIAFAHAILPGVSNIWGTSNHPTFIISKADTTMFFSWVLNAKKLRLPSGFKPSEPHLSAYLVASGTSNDSAGPRMNHQVSMRFFMPCPGVHGCTRCGVCVWNI